MQRFALSILDGTIQRAWKVLPAEQAEGIKEFVVQNVIALASSFESMENEKTFVLKLNQVLIKIVVQEWPDKWPTFISDLVGASKSSESLCENNMRILKLLSDEVSYTCTHLGIDLHCCMYRSAVSCIHFSLELIHARYISLSL